MVENISALTSAVEALNKQSDGLVTSFGRLAESSKTWNIISRLLSGSGLWQLQNRIRAVGNVVNLYNLNLAANLEKQVAAMDAAKQMKNALVDLEAEQKALVGSEYVKMLQEGYIDKGYNKATAEILALKDATREYDGAISAIEEKQEKMTQAGPFAKLGAFLQRGDYYDHTVKGMVHDEEDPANHGKLIQSSIEANFLAIKDRKTRITDYFKNKKYMEIGGKVSQFFSGKMKIIGRYFEVGVVLFGAFSKYLLIATLIVALIRTLWPSFKAVIEAVGGMRNTFDNIIKNIKLIFGGFFDIIVGLFKGDFLRVFEGLGKVVVGIIGVVLNFLHGFVKVLIGILLAIHHKIGKFIKRSLGFRATGGPASGLTVVGERGPELVNLPAGSRVHSNADSRRMAGNTINVNVAGRIGASDAEIKDIANKVAREINMRMNRTSSTVSRF